MKNNDFIAYMDKISKGLSTQERLVNSSVIQDIRGVIDRYKENIEEILITERSLKIGIVGEVKAGKSTFLNSLIFNGEQILPEAPTPMTAALTKMNYAENQKAKIVFYSSQDWGNISARAQEYDEILDELFEEEMIDFNNQMSLVQGDVGGGMPMLSPTKEELEERHKDSIPIALRSCKEAVQLSEKSGVDKQEWLGKVIEIGAEDMSMLDEYVGADGKYTAIVKYTELFLDNPLLTDVEVIDTPGLNDPILSRSEVTKRFLLNCDVVFVLSYVGQFLGESDMTFIRSTLPNEGINKAILVGSKLDSGVLDFNKKGASFVEAYRSSMFKYNKQAEKNLHEASRKYTSTALSEMKLPPYYISSIFYTAGKHLIEDKPLSELESHIIKVYSNRFSDFNADGKYLVHISGIDNIKNKEFQKIKASKDIIISNRVKNLDESQSSRLILMLEEVSINARNNLDNLKKYDMDELKEIYAKISAKLTGIRTEIRHVFEISAIDSTKILNQLKIEISSEIDSFTRISIGERTENKRESYREGIFGIKKVSYLKTSTIKTANITDVLDNLRKFTNKAQSKINSDFEHLFDVEELKKKLKTMVSDAMDLTDSNFNENDVLLPLERVLRELSLPKLEIEKGKHEEIILGAFSNYRVEDQDIQKLQVLQNNALSKIAEDIAKEIDNTSVDIKGLLQKEAGIFVDKIETQLLEQLDILEKTLENKEESIKAYNIFIDNIKEYKQGLIRYGK